MRRLTRDGTAKPVSRDQILRRERGQGNTRFPCSADHEQDYWLLVTYNIRLTHKDNNTVQYSPPESADYKSPANVMRSAYKRTKKILKNRVHIKTWLELLLFGYASRTVSYTRELISVPIICYSQGNGFNTPLSRLLHSTIHPSQLWLCYSGVRLRSWCCVMSHLGRR